jgi:hypothetical protein
VTCVDELVLICVTPLSRKTKFGVVHIQINLLCLLVQIYL